MDIDYDAGNADYTTVPPGTYRCKVAEVRTGQTRAGDERWSLRLVVSDGGPFNGKQAAWDSLVWSIRGRMRARPVCGIFGVPLGKKVQIEPQDLVGREALVTVRVAEYTSPEGVSVKRNEVPYDGYSSCQ